jgi:GNAT superfamily N-acetyltransferase
MEFPFSLEAQGTIRLAHDGDFRHLEWHGGADLRSFYEASWHAHQKDESTVLIADMGGFPIGQIVIIWGGKQNHPHFPDLQSLRVHPAFRGLGIGSRLLEAAETLAAERGFSQVGLSVGLDNPHARRLYERLGYESTNAIYDDEWSYIDQNGNEVHNVERVTDLVKKIGVHIQSNEAMRAEDVQNRNPQAPELTAQTPRNFAKNPA